MLLIVLILFVNFSESLDNGEALTPKMGWLSWERFMCNIDCVTYPDTCISEKLYMAQADLLVSLGLKDAGYVFVDIDDCWSNKTRAADGSLQADNDRFPSGIPALAAYMHQRGLKLGIYGDVGTSTCGGYPGSYGYFQQDANTFASWGVDSLKLDGCNANVDDYATLYPQMGAALNASGRAIMYACSWPAYMQGNVSFLQVAKFCNYWRAYNDIYDDWTSVSGIIEWWGSNTLMPAAAGPGSWNDPDQLLIGGYGLSYDQQKTQMAIWCIVAAPLLMSNDLREIEDQYVAILANSEAVAVNQDSLGKQGIRVLQAGGFEWWLKPLSGGNFALAIYNTTPWASATYAVTQFSAIGLSANTFTIRDIFEQQTIGTFSGSFQVLVNPHGVFFATLTPS